MSYVLLPRLVPQPLWGRNLRSAIGSRWAAVSTELRSIAGNHCEICGGWSIGAPVNWQTELHEVWMYEDEHRTAYLTDLQVICWWCHAVIHWGRTMAEHPPLQTAVLQHALAVNGSPTQADYLRMVVGCFKAWKRRSEHADWAIDWDDWPAVYEAARERLLG